jgi:hypothetical protein
MRIGWRAVREAETIASGWELLLLFPHSCSSSSWASCVSFSCLMKLVKMDTGNGHRHARLTSISIGIVHHLFGYISINRSVLIIIVPVTIVSVSIFSELSAPRLASDGVVRLGRAGVGYNAVPAILAQDQENGIVELTIIMLILPFVCL